MIFRLIILWALLLTISYMTGLLFFEFDEIFKALAAGLTVEWGTFIFPAVYCIVTERTLTVLIRFMTVIYLLLAVSGVALAAVRLKKYGKNKIKNKQMLTKGGIIYLGIFIALVAFQIYKTLFYNYADGDDSFYVAVSQAAEVSDKLYLSEPYTGTVLGVSVINYRYALAPFPIWIAALARLTGLNAATAAHVGVAPYLVMITYVIYILMAKLLFPESREKQYMFLCLLAVFAMFADVSTSTAETFLLTRARQGKEALANVIIPFAIFIFLDIFKRSGQENGEKTDIEECGSTRTGSVTIKDVILLLTVTSAGALTSLFSNVLLPLLFLAAVIYMIIKKERPAGILGVLFSLAPCAAVLLLYIKLG